LLVIGARRVRKPARVLERITRSMIGVEPPRWQGARRAHTPGM
jgi:hypothetical protein